MLLLAIYSTVGPGRNVVANSECRGVVVAEHGALFQNIRHVVVSSGFLAARNFL